jgi:hypothetical protein
MSTTHGVVDRRQTYYVPGSGLFAVPGDRLNEIPALKAEFHSAEASKAMAAALVRKPM